MIFQQCLYLFLSGKRSVIDTVAIGNEWMDFGVTHRYRVFWKCMPVLRRRGRQTERETSARTQTRFNGHFNDCEFVSDANEYPLRIHFILATISVSQPFFNVHICSFQFFLLLLSFCFVCLDTDKRLSFILTWCMVDMCACYRMLAIETNAASPSIHWCYICYAL